MSFLCIIIYNYRQNVYKTFVFMLYLFHPDLLFIIIVCFECVCLCCLLMIISICLPSVLHRNPDCFCPVLRNTCGIFKCCRFCMHSFIYGAFSIFCFASFNISETLLRRCDVAFWKYGVSRAVFIAMLDNSNGEMFNGMDETGRTMFRMDEWAHRNASQCETNMNW